MQRPSQSPRPKLATLTALVVPLWVVSCGPAEAPEPSKLAEKAAAAEANEADKTNEAKGTTIKKAPADPPATTPATSKTSPTKDTPGAEPNAEAKPPELLKVGKGETKVELRLALPDDTTYRITTVGMIKYPAMPKSTGFAREELIKLDECTGEGSARSCQLEHSIVNFEAEPPYGRFIAADEAPARDLTSRYRIGARGERLSESVLEAPPETADSDKVKALAQVELFYCIRFPGVPVGTGAAWKTTCTVRNDGRLSTRDATWEVVKIDENTDDGHTRVELRVLGKTTTQGSRGESEGTFGGTLFFFADIGEPHLLREEISTQVAKEGGIRTTARLNYQFAKMQGETALRTDGQP
ncbi:MAG TPA: hypothetical protein ENJ18_03405, partial [Nannocystis exedens]|nr:hypothetical protein [Nannocystis exedens]